MNFSTQTFGVYQYSPVELVCRCMGIHGDHFEVRTTNIPSRLVVSGCEHCRECRGLQWYERATVVPEPEAVFDGYRRLLLDNAALNTSEWEFKSDRVYRQFLEHVTFEGGKRYLELLSYLPRWSGRLRTIVAETALANDSVGLPIRCEFDPLGVTCSPTNLRYAWQAYMLLQHIEQLGLTRAHVIEIGGGYGGFSLFMRRLAPMLYSGTLSHTIVDVPEAGAIQTSYASQFAVPLSVVDGTDADAIEATVNSTPADERVFFSAYGFSELSASLRDWYEENLTQHCPHGFVVWNRVAPYPLAKATATIEDEPVLTEAGVKLVLY